MNIKIKRKIGDCIFEFGIEEKNDIDALSKAGNLSSMPSACGMCKSDNVHLSSNTSKDGYVFVKIICKDCNARSQMGQYKVGGVFWKQWEKYLPPGKSKKMYEEYSGGYPDEEEDIDIS